MAYDIPFVPSSDDSVRTMVRLANVQKGELAVDLGAGDGKLVIALAEAGALTVGIEIDKQRYKLARFTAQSRGLAHQVTMACGSFWKYSLSPYDIIVVYGVPSIMDRLERKITNEAKRTCRILSNYFEFPNWHAAQSENHIHLYKPFELFAGVKRQTAQSSKK